MCLINYPETHITFNLGHYISLYRHEYSTYVYSTCNFLKHVTLVHVQQVFKTRFIIDHWEEIC